MEKQAWAMREEVGDIPVSILTAAYAGSTETNEQQNVIGQQGWLVLSPRAEQLVMQTGHDIISEARDVVIAETLKVLAAARGG